MTTTNENQRHVESIRDELTAVYNGEVMNDEGEPVSMWDYLLDEGYILDIDYLVDSNREYKACRLLIAFGGPNIYINTISGNVELFWWGDTAKAWIPSEVCDEIDEVMSELFNC